jgi:myo-inositol-1(or 4)-monophosphatase
VFDPVRDELFTAARGGGARLNGEPIRTSDAADLQRALIATGFSYLPEERESTAGMLKTILPRVRDIRRIGSAALDLCWVACGRFDGYYEVPVHHWDRAAGELIAREAGAFTHVLDAVGVSGPGLIVAAPRLFDELRALVIAAHPTATIAPDA